MELEGVLVFVQAVLRFGCPYLVHAWLGVVDRVVLMQHSPYLLCCSPTISHNCLARVGMLFLPHFASHSVPCLFEPHEFHVEPAVLGLWGVLTQCSNLLFFGHLYGYWQHASDCATAEGFELACSCWDANVVLKLCDAEQRRLASGEAFASFIRALVAW
jgi:hypothetical protein